MRETATIKRKDVEEVADKIEDFCNESGLPLVAIAGILEVIKQRVIDKIRRK